jgi:threonine dehydrogenase-like Zn-dependent dehydrogenase
MPGAFAEFISVPCEALVKLPQNVSDNEGACIQSLGSSMATVADTNIKVGDTVVVLGQGVMGLNILQLSRVSGAGATIGVDIKPTNLKLSQLLGADHSIDASKEDVVALVQDLTHGVGADIVFECAGGSPKEGLSGSKSLEQALQIVADTGKVIQVANIGPTIEFRPDILRKKSIRYIFPLNSTSLSSLLFQHAVRLVANGQVKIKPTITHILSGLDKVPQSFEITANKAKYAAVNPAQVIVSP